MSDVAITPSAMRGRVLDVVGSAPRGVCRLSNAEIADKCNCATRTVNRALADLVSRGLITVAYERTTGPGQVGRTIRRTKKVAS